MMRRNRRIDRLVKSMSKKLGAVFDYSRLGYMGTLCAVKTCPDRKRSGRTIKPHSRRTHNY
jgi:hypothetical protein